jgi:hypothetical protein
MKRAVAPALASGEIALDITGDLPTAGIASGFQLGNDFPDDSSVDQRAIDQGSVAVADVGEGGPTPVQVDMGFTRIWIEGFSWHHLSSIYGAEREPRSGSLVRHQASIGARQSSAPEVPATVCSQSILR